MSVFGDFRRVWVKRFPNSELPAAWEEDVRANLAKHKQKVAVLREELEKEEFYVEYLERLLQDVAASKKEKIVEPAPRKANDSRRDRAYSNLTGLGSSGGDDDNSDEFDSRIIKSGSKDSIDQCITELSRGLSETDVSPSSPSHPGENSSSNCHEVHEAQEQEVAPIQEEISAGISPDPSNYITVIEVNSVVAKGEKNNGVPEKQMRSASSPTTNQAAPVRKAPPIPPPKRFNKIKDPSVEAPVSPAEAKRRKEEEDAAVAALNEAVEAAEASQSALDETLDKDLDYRDPIDLVEDEEEEPYYDSVPLDGGLVSDVDEAEFTEDSEDAKSATLPSHAWLQNKGASPSPVFTCEPESPGKNSNYVNIDYFIMQRAGAATRSSSVESEDDGEVPPLMRTISIDTEPNDDLLSTGSFSEANYATTGSSSSLESSLTSTTGDKAEAERMTMYRCIISSIMESETLYVECLAVLVQYMKAIKATLGTSQPVISEQDLNTVFYKIPDLHRLHQAFLEGLQKRSLNWDGRLTIGDHFKIMASNINVYGAFLHNYSRAVDTVARCSANSNQFNKLTRDIPLPSQSGQNVSLEDLLHKPVARVQKNALVLHDLLKYTPVSHPDHKTLSEALELTQSFLDEFNMIHTKAMFPAADRAQRRLVRNSFIVELADGHRKLRHLFLFNDVIACAKYKASGREKYTFELKWYIPLSDIVIFEEPGIEPRESSPPNIVALKSAASTVRDQLLWEERAVGVERQRRSSRSEKHKKKLADLEAQLVLASPNLVFRVGNRTSRAYTFFLSSEFERTQWIEAVHALQSSQLPGPAVTVSMLELQAWITACRSYLKTNMGSYLLRSGKDESLLVGDLHLTLKELTGLDQAADLYICVELDSYGHYFRKAKTKLVCNSSSPRWDESFVIELEGAQNLRILLYEEAAERPLLRAKCTHKLSRSWLSEQKLVEQTVELNNLYLTLSLRFVPSEVTLRRVPTAKAGALFGAKILQVCKRQKRPVPFIITSCIREVERRGMNEVGVYRVSGSASDLSRLKKSFETNSYEAEQLLKDVDIHSATGVLKLYLRELPEALFTDELYPKFFQAFNGNREGDARTQALEQCFNLLPPLNQGIINYIISHLIRVNQHEAQNKMSMHNLATVFGPTLLRPGTKLDSNKTRDPLAAGTVDVMAQAGILYHFLLQAQK